MGIDDPESGQQFKEAGRKNSETLFLFIRSQISAVATRRQHLMLGSLDMTPDDLDEKQVMDALIKLGLVGMMATLSGHVFKRVLGRGRSQLVQDYSGGSALSERSQALFLYSDATFRLDEKIFRTITGGGVSLPSEEVRSLSGKWLLEITEDVLYLVLKRDGTVIDRWPIEAPPVEGPLPSTVSINGERWKALRI